MRGPNICFKGKIWTVIPFAPSILGTGWYYIFLLKVLLCKMRTVNIKDKIMMYWTQLGLNVCIWDCSKLCSSSKVMDTPVGFQCSR